MARRKKGPAAAGRPKRPRERMVVEEETIARIEALPPPQRTVLMPVYLVASFWPWWLTFLVPTFIAWRVLPGVQFLEWATWLFLTLAGGGYLVKHGIQRLVGADRA